MLWVCRAEYCLTAQGMSLVPSVTELLLAEFLYLQYENSTAPIYMYINSAGVQVWGFLQPSFSACLPPWPCIQPLIDAL